jgi:hypothetical protein
MTPTAGAGFAVLHAVFEPTVLFFVQFGGLLSYCMRKILIHRSSCVDEMANMVRLPKDLLNLNFVNLTLPEI